jgi:predicted transcriptional regulator
MPYIGKIAKPAPTLDHQANTFDATEELILLGQDHAFIKKNDRIIGMVCVDNLLEECKSGDISSTNVAEFVEPLFFVKEYELRSKAKELMLINDIELIAVTNNAGDFVGIASLKQMKGEP